MAKRKPLDEMNMQETIEHMNKLRDYRHYASTKGFDLMVEQIELELEKSQNHYEDVLKREAEAYEKRHNKDGDNKKKDEHIIFQTSDSNRDDE